MTLNPNLLSQAITSQEVDYSAWYHQAIRQGGMIDESMAPGTWALLPNATRLWNNIRSQMTDQMDRLDVEEVTLPTLFPYSLLAAEKDHIEGFAPEVYTVTQAGSTQLEEPLVLRPTSEVVVSEYFKRWAKSYRDLPLYINQWGSVFRNELRPRPFLRTSEFMWQEGHSAHMSNQDAETHARKMAVFYKDFLSKSLSLFGFEGEKSENERFAGAKSTFTLEAMYGNKVLQLATAHNLGDTFSRAQDVTVAGPSGEQVPVYQSSWGSSTRLLGAIVMAHGDNKGLVLPPQVAGTQAVIIPAWKGEDSRATVSEVAEKVFNELPIRTRIADRSKNTRLGNIRFAEEKMGTPVQIVMGMRELDAGKASIIVRDTGEEISLPLESLASEMPGLLSAMAARMTTRSKSAQEAILTDSPTSEGEMLEAVNAGYIVRAGWRGTRADEVQLKRRSGMTVRLHEYGDNDDIPDVINGGIGRPTLFAKSY